MKLLLLLLITTTLLFSQIKSGKYDVSYGLLGDIGSTEASLIINDDDTYKITVTSHASSATKIISKNYTETLISEGKIVNSKYLPLIFKKTIERDDQIKKETFIFNHETRSVILEELKLTKVLSNFDFDDNNTSEQTKNDDDYSWNISGNTTNLDIYAKEDILTLFFNITNYMDDLKIYNINQVTVMGTNSKKEYTVDLIIPQKEQYKQIQKLLNTKENVLIFKLHSKVFFSESGELYVSLGKNRIAAKAILKDVLLFGKIKGI